MSATRYGIVVTAPTVYGIETVRTILRPRHKSWSVVTAPTVYGIETVMVFESEREKFEL